MALIARATDAGPDGSMALTLAQVPGLLAGENIDAAAPCYIAADGMIYMTNGTAVNVAASFVGFAWKSARAGRAVTLLGVGQRFRYSAGTLTPGAVFYAHTVAGQLNDAATTGGTRPLAMAVDTTDIIVIATPHRGA